MTGNVIRYSYITVSVPYQINIAPRKCKIKMFFLVYAFNYLYVSWSGAYYCPSDSNYRASRVFIC